MDPVEQARRTARRTTVRSAIVVLAAFGLPALIVVVLQGVDFGTRVRVAGAGAVAQLDRAPEGYRYELDVVPSEPIAATRDRIGRSLAGWPDYLVFGFDARQLAGGEAAEAEARAALLDLTERVEGAATVPLVLAFVPPPDADEALRAAIERTDRWWREEVCQTAGLRLCVHAETLDDVPAAVAAALPDAVARHEEWANSTQVGR